MKSQRKDTRAKQPAAREVPQSLLEALREAGQDRTPTQLEIREWLEAERERSRPKGDQAATDHEARNSGKAWPSAASWSEIEIAFLSDERVEICAGANNRQTHNYGELGFEDRRNGKPDLAWVTLREMAAKNGAWPRPMPGKQRAMVQKRIEEIRKRLQQHFRIEADPIPFNGNTYQASFKISRRPSFDT